MLASFLAIIVGVVFVPARTDAAYALTENQQTVVSFAAHSSQPVHFDTASEAAYAAALTYSRRLLPGDEVGAKIYVDFPFTKPQYTFGPLIVGQNDPQTSDEEITYNTQQADGHFAVVGLWHEHPASEPLDSMYQHYDEIARTKQTIWTSIGKDLYVQYWNGSSLAPQWRSNAAQMPAAVCRACMP